MVIYAGVEGGGTTWRVALAEGHPSNIVESKSFVTLEDSQEQLKQIKDWLSTRSYDCLGIGTFGPIDPREVCGRLAISRSFSFPLVLLSTFSLELSQRRALGGTVDAR